MMERVKTQMEVIRVIVPVVGVVIIVLMTSTNVNTIRVEMVAPLPKRKEGFLPKSELFLSFSQ